MKCTLFVLLTFFSFFSISQAESQKSFVTSESLQTPSNCGETLTINFQNAGFMGGNFSFNVIAPPTCNYSIASSAPSWLMVTSPSTASGNSTVTYKVSFNSSASGGRVGVIVVGGRTFTVNQGAKGGGAVPTALDFNGDKTSDFVVIQNANGNMVWWIYRYHIVTGPSTSAVTFGLFDSDIPVPNDFDGDFKTDVAVWRPGAGPNSQAYFYVFLSATNTVQVVPFGTFGDNPNITQDFDGDFKADYAVARKQNGTLVWYVLLSATGGVWIQQFGNETDKPIRGDYDGDYHADIAVYRPNTSSPANTFFVLKSSNDTLSAVTFGLSDIDKLVPGDYDGDRKTDYAVWRTTTGVWYWISSLNGSFNAYPFGASSDLPVPGDYNNDFRSDYAVWRPDANQGVFWVQITGGTPFLSILPWGNSTMKIPANSMQTQ